MYTLALMVTSAAIGGTLQYGYNLAIMNAPTVVRDSVLSGLCERGKRVAFIFAILVVCVYLLRLITSFVFCVPSCSSFKRLSMRHFRSDGEYSWGFMRSH